MKRNRQTGCVRDQSLFSPKEGEVFRGDGGGCIRYPQSVRGGGNLENWSLINCQSGRGSSESYRGSGTQNSSSPSSPFPPPPPPPRAGSINNDWHDWLPSDLMYGNRSRGRFRTIFNEDVFTFLLALGNLDRLTKCMWRITSERCRFAVLWCHCFPRTCMREHQEVSSITELIFVDLDVFLFLHWYFLIAETFLNILINKDHSWSKKNAAIWLAVPANLHSVIDSEQST